MAYNPAWYSSQPSPLPPRTSTSYSTVSAPPQQSYYNNASSSSSIPIPTPWGPAAGYAQQPTAAPPAAPVAPGASAYQQPIGITSPLASAIPPTTSTFSYPQNQQYSSYPQSAPTPAPGAQYPPPSSVTNTNAAPTYQQLYPSTTNPISNSNPTSAGYPPTSYLPQYPPTPQPNAFPQTYGAPAPVDAQAHIAQAPGGYASQQLPIQTYSTTSAYASGGWATFPVANPLPQEPPQGGSTGYQTPVNPPSSKAPSPPPDVFEMPAEMPIESAQPVTPQTSSDTAQPSTQPPTPSPATSMPPAISPLVHPSQPALEEARKKMQAQSDPSPPPGAESYLPPKRDTKFHNPSPLSPSTPAPMNGGSALAASMNNLNLNQQAGGTVPPNFKPNSEHGLGIFAASSTPKRWTIADPQIEQPTQECLAIIDLLFETIDQSFEPRNSGFCEASKVISLLELKEPPEKGQDVQAFAIDNYRGLQIWWALSGVEHFLKPTGSPMMPPGISEAARLINFPSIPPPNDATPLPTYTPTLTHHGFRQLLFMNFCTQPEDVKKLIDAICSDTYSARPPPTGQGHPDVHLFDPSVPTSLASRARDLMRASLIRALMEVLRSLTGKQNVDGEMRLVRQHPLLRDQVNMAPNEILGQVVDGWRYRDK